MCKHLEHPECRERKPGPDAGVKAGLTNGLGHRHDLGAVVGQVAKGPDDGVHLLHDVEGDGHDAARVLSHSHTPGERTRPVHSQTQWMWLVFCSLNMGRESRTGA